MLNIKAFYNEEIRRLVLPEPSWDQLKQRLAELFHFPSTSSFQVKWKDDEDDYITLDSDEELAQALRYTDPQQLLRLFIVSHATAATPMTRGSMPAQGPFTSFFTHSTPYASFSAAPMAGSIPPPSSFVPYQPRGLPLASSVVQLQQAATTTDAKAASAPGAVANVSGGAPAPSSAPIATGGVSTPVPVVAPGLLVGSPTLAAAGSLFASKREFKEQWKQEKRALKEQKYLCGNKEEWKTLKKEQKKALKHKKDLVKTSHKLMRMERVFDPQDPKDHKKLYKLQQKQYKTTARALYARFVKHVSIPDGTEMAPDTPFVKTWRFRNEGTMPWPQEVTLMFISKINGDQMGAPEFVPVNTVVMPGEEVDVSVHMVSPSRAGHYQAYFRLCYGPKKFGQRVWIKINVACTSEAENDDEHVKSAKEIDSLVDDDNSSNDTPVPAPSFIEGVNDDLAAAAAAAAAPVAGAPDQALLQKLSDLGFTDRDHNASLLAQHNGDIDVVVDQLLVQEQHQQQQ